MEYMISGFFSDVIPIDKHAIEELIAIRIAKSLKEMGGLANISITVKAIDINSAPPDPPEPDLFPEPEMVGEDKLCEKINKE